MPGEGYEKLLTQESEPITDKVVAIAIDKIKPNPFQPRQDISWEKIEELAQSIKSCGLIQPILVRRSGTSYELIVGERRYLACRRLGWKKISAAIKTLPDSAMATAALVENLQREDLHYFDEANGYLNLMNNSNITQDQLAQKLGKSQSTIANKIRLLKLPQSVRRKLLENGLSERHARALLGLSSEQDQFKMLQKILEERLTVSQLEKSIAKITGQKKGTTRNKRPKPIIKDMRIVLNTIREAVAIIKKSGLNPAVKEIFHSDYIEITIRIPREKDKEVDFRP